MPTPLIYVYQPFLLNPPPPTKSLQASFPHPRTIPLFCSSRNYASIDVPKSSAYPWLLSLHVSPYISCTLPSILVNSQPESSQHPLPKLLQPLPHPFLQSHPPPSISYPPSCCGSDILLLQPTFFICLQFYQQIASKNPPPSPDAVFLPFSSENPEIHLLLSTSEPSEPDFSASVPLSNLLDAPSLMVWESLWNIYGCPFSTSSCQAKLDIPASLPDKFNSPLNSQIIDRDHLHFIIIYIIIKNNKTQGLLYHRTCKPDFLCSWLSLNSYLK